jgi:hypothetical protein
VSQADPDQLGRWIPPAAAQRAGDLNHPRRLPAAAGVGDHVGASPVDRGKPGSKLHLVCDSNGLPLTAAVTAANVTDVTMLAALVDDIPPVRTPSGHPAWCGPRGQGI